MKKPRPFNHRLIYIDSRQERLAEIEQRARRELGFVDSTSTQSGDLHGVFSRVQRHTKRLQRDRMVLSVPKLVLLIVVLLIIWRYLL